MLIKFEDEDLSALTIEELRNQVQVQRRANRWQRALLEQAREANISYIKLFTKITTRNHQLEEEVEKLNKRVSDMGWQLNPDRMGK